MSAIEAGTAEAGFRARNQTPDKAAERLSPIVPLYLFCVTISIFFYVGPLYLNTLRLLLLVLMVPLAVQLIRGRYGPMILTDGLFLAYFLWSVASLAVNNPDSVVQQSGSTGAEFLGGYLVGRAFIRTRTAFLTMCKQLVFCVLVILPFGLLESRTGNALIPDLIRKAEARAAQMEAARPTKPPARRAAVARAMAMPVSTPTVLARGA